MIQLFIIIFNRTLADIILFMILIKRLGDYVLTTELFS